MVFTAGHVDVSRGVGMDDPVNRDERRELWPESWWLVGLLLIAAAPAVYWLVRL